MVRFTVGGWVATRACGQFSSAYGGVEDLVMGLEVVLASGDVLNTRLTPRASAGPDLKQFSLGSEGTLGIITAVTYSLHCKPEKQDYSAFCVPDMEKGFETQRYLIRSGWSPPVMRQYDATEVKRLFPVCGREEDGLIILVHKGKATIKAGGGISHHHGNGRVRRQWMVDEIGETGVALV
jgi:alkyldihydroxyacetonephosphate synthase